MVDIELVIKIDESKLWALKNEPIKENFNIYELASYIDRGTPLPKGHGALKDVDYLKDVILLHNFHGNNKNIVPYKDRKGYRLRQREVDEAIINAPTIIEAYKGEADEK